MKITHHIKPRDDQDMAYGLQGGGIKNTYWATFGIWPSDVQWTIESAAHPEVLEEWAAKSGFSMEATSIGIHASSEQDRWAEKSLMAYIHKEDKMILAYTLTMENKMNIGLFFPAEIRHRAVKDQVHLTKTIGTSRSSGRINLMAMEQGDFYLMSLALPKPKVDLVLNYGREFTVVHSEIKKIISEEGSGLILLHGVTGSGKSTYIYNLIHQCKQKMIFIPNNMVASMANPDFVNFLLMQAKKAVLVIEDAEKVLLKRGGGDDAGVSTLLNITDGILGQLLQCKVICTFNIARSELDTALLRKGRLRKEHEFKALPVEDANKLLKHLGSTRRTTVPLTVADIYNEEGGREVPESRVGF